MPKKIPICPHMAAMEEEDKKWKTRSDMEALVKITEIKKDPERVKRLRAHIKEKQSEVNVLDTKYLSSIGL